jgi:hypothetical protein
MSTQRRRGGDGGGKGGHHRRRGGAGTSGTAGDEPKDAVVIGTLASSVMSGADVAALLYEARASAETVEKELSVTHRSPAKELRAHLTFVKDQMERTRTRHDLVCKAERAHLLEWEARNERLVMAIEAELSSVQATLQQSRAMLAEAQRHLVERRDLAGSIRVLHRGEIVRALEVERALGALVATPPSSNVVTLVHVDVPDAAYLSDLRPKAWRDSREVIMRTLRARLALSQGGYEVRRGVDSYLAAFRGPEEALKFCFSAQEQLVREDWPLAMLHTSVTREVKETRAKTVGGDQSASAARRRKEHTYVLFRGPRVRMACVSGLPEAAPSAYGSRTIFGGLQHARLVAVAAAAAPGQIIVDDAAAMVVHEKSEEWDYPSAVDLGEFDTGAGRAEALHSVLPESLSGRERGFASVGDPDAHLWDPERASQATKSSSSLLLARSRANLHAAAGGSGASLAASRGNLLSRGGARSSSANIVSLEPPAVAAASAGHGGGGQLSARHRAHLLHRQRKQEQQELREQQRRDRLQRLNPDPVAPDHQGGDAGSSVSHGGSTSSLTAAQHHHQQQQQQQQQQDALHARSRANTTNSAGGASVTFAGDDQSESNNNNNNSNTIRTVGGDGAVSDGGGGGGGGGASDVDGDGDGGKDHHGSDDDGYDSYESEIDAENGDGDAGTRFMSLSLVEHDAKYLDELDESVREAENLVTRLKGAVRRDEQMYRRTKHMVLEFRTNASQLLDFMRGQIVLHSESVDNLTLARNDARQCVENIVAHMNAIRTRWFDEICPTANRIPGLQREIIQLIQAKRSARVEIVDERSTYLKEISQILGEMGHCSDSMVNVDKSLDNIWLWVEFRLLKDLGYLI